jgi:hypothetical protein
MRKLPVGLICRNPTALPLPPNHRQISCCPVLTKRGASRSSRTLRRDAVDAGGATDESADLRTAKPCGPDAPTLASSFAKQFARRRWQESPVTGESAEETVKTIAQGRPDETGEPVVTTLVCFLFFAREAAGAVVHPAFPVPSSEGLHSHDPGVDCAAEMWACVLQLSCPASSGASSRGVSIEHRVLWDAGSPGQAGR